ncbi:hypothetical protein [Thiofilum flexile]|uniref:hypothetical protein n=1 Tax=Thiofilum flexile TaxID=125627 RepID=UPI0003758127|nr:hypothetical protein [Thiofilum flexile]
MKFMLVFIVILALILLYFGLRLLLKHDNKTIRRLAYTISALWLAIPFLFIAATKGFRLGDINEQEWIAWTVGALIPNILIWSIIWVLNGLFAPNTSSKQIAKKLPD